MADHPHTAGGSWPQLPPYPEWEETCSALHLWAQIAGKYRLAHTPWVNHSWHATLYVTPRGLTTGLVPDPARAVTIDFDFHEHALSAHAEHGASAGFPLQTMSVAEFFKRTREAITAVGGTPRMHDRPNEVADPVPFADDTRVRRYDAAAVQRYHRALLCTARVFEQFRTEYLGKVSPVHLFWGAFDLAVTRFSGRSAPLHPGGVPSLPDAVTRDAYSHEVSSAGFWPGGNGIDEAMFYSYAYAEPPGFAQRQVEPQDARYERSLGEFLLPYETVRCSSHPAAALLRFLRSTYAAAADCGGWDRAALECEPGRPRVPRVVAPTSA